MTDEKPASAPRSVARLLLHTIGWPIATFILLFSLLCLSVLFSGWLVPILIALLIIGITVWRRRLRWYAGLSCALFFMIFFVVSLRTPQQDRNWEEPLTVLPRCTIDGAILTIEGVRNFEWRSRDDYDARWETRSYDIDKLRSIDMIVQPFGWGDLTAHTMLTFDFGDDGHLLLTIEARRIDGQAWGPVAGILNEFELIYIFADERDALGVRAIQGHEFYALPTVTDPLWRKAFLLSLCATSNSILNRPRFYHTLRDNCTTEWLRAVDKLSGRIWGVQIDTILNGRVGRLLHRTGAVDTDLSYEDARRHFRLDQRVLRHLHDPDFSNLIRQSTPL
ncbi:MAG: DUF4105 domain-containing protein [Phycisphaeraceae bacterium]|nr:MAG: DUF4105 domain-containing protein [Phycisphaeraceae bacterium]